MINNLLILDIETVPQFETYDLLSPSWQILWYDKISKTVPENTIPQESYHEKAGIFAEFGKIVCISTAFFYLDERKQTSLKVKSIFGENEKDVLEAFIQLCNKVYYHNPHFQFAGHNVKEFDIPFICRRLIVNHLALPDYLHIQEKKPWEVNIFDTLSWWKFGDHKNYITLHLLANVLGIPSSKSDMDGSMVQDVFYKEKNLRRIADYCEKDVIVTSNIILRFLNLSVLTVENITIVKSSNEFSVKTIEEGRNVLKDEN